MAEDLKIPKISVIMPLYNGEKYLKEAIDSILNQTYTDFELLLINDASKDDTERIVRSYNDDRIVYIKNEINLGLINTLNKGLELAKGKFIARMDQDDISLPERFEKQIDILEKNPEIGVCGTWFTPLINGISGKTIQHPEHSESIKISLLAYCALGHPTIMLRKKFISNLRYDPDYQAAEDYEFWTRLSRIGKLYNIQESLLQYRFHETNMSVLEENTQSKNAKKIIGNQLKYIGLEDNDSNIKFSETLFGNFYINPFSEMEFRKLIIFANNLESNNKHKRIYSEEELTKTITERLLKIFNKIEKKKLSLISFVFHQRKELLVKQGFLVNLKMLAKMILKK